MRFRAVVFGLAAGTALCVTGCAQRTPPAALPSPPAVASNAELIEAFGRLELEARETERGVVVYLPAVYLFAFDSDTLSPEALSKLLDVAGVLNQPGAVGRTLTIEGHTDSVGSDEYNAGLSERRAQSVRAQLLVGNVAAQRMTTRGLGETAPRAPNANADGSDNPEGRAANRRVELVIARAGG